MNKPIKIGQWELDIYSWGRETEEELPILDWFYHKFVSPITQGGKLTGVARTGFTAWIVLFRRKYSITFEKPIHWNKEDMSEYWKRVHSKSLNRKYWKTLFSRKSS